MTNEEILTKAIEKAITNGFHRIVKFEVTTRYGTLDGKVSSELFITEYRGVDNQFVRELPIQTLIFNHDFAKALWKREDDSAIPLWYQRLQEMVVAEDPIKYLGEHL